MRAKRVPAAMRLRRTSPLTPLRKRRGGYYWIVGSVAIIFLLTGAADAAAGRIYSYTDEHGIVHFTDKPPETEAQVDIAHPRPRPESVLRTHKRGPDTAPEWYFENRIHGPLEVEVSLTDSENIQTSPALPRRFVLPSRSQTKLFDIGPADPARSWRYRFSTRYTPGDPRARHDDRVAYLPPFAPGGEFVIGQAFGGTFSHNEPESLYAVDIAMPVGTPVHAARAGVVMEVERWFGEGGADREQYIYQANYVRILHEDGTMAIYAHLDYRGTAVRPGQVVLEGERIGVSGNTGFSTGPHLHFAVQRNAGMRIESVPFKFRDEFDQSVIPRHGQHLRRTQ